VKPKYLTVEFSWLVYSEISIAVIFPALSNAEKCQIPRPSRTQITHFQDFCAYNRFAALKAIPVATKLTITVHANVLKLITHQQNIVGTHKKEKYFSLLFFKPQSFRSKISRQLYIRPIFHDFPVSKHFPGLSMVCRNPELYAKVL